MLVITCSRERLCGSMMFLPICYIDKYFSAISICNLMEWQQSMLVSILRSILVNSRQDISVKHNQVWIILWWWVWGQGILWWFATWVLRKSVDESHRFSGATKWINGIPGVSKCGRCGPMQGVNQGAPVLVEGEWQAHFQCASKGCQSVCEHGETCFYDSSQGWETQGEASSPCTIASVVVLKASGNLEFVSAKLLFSFCSSLLSDILEYSDYLLNYTHNLPALCLE
jgi:hypothetical protein